MGPKPRVCLGIVEEYRIREMKLEVIILDIYKRIQSEITRSADTLISKGNLKVEFERREGLELNETRKLEEDFRTAC